MEYAAIDRRNEGRTVLEQCRLVQLYMLDVVDELCRKHNIRYFLAFGSLLGAIRHNGYIPWDDDLDIGMPMDDYRRFLKIAAEELPDSIVIQNPATTAGSPYWFTKLRDTKSFYMTANTHYDMPMGIFIDINPFEKMPSLPAWLRKLVFHLCSVSYFSESAHRRVHHRHVCGILISFAKASVWKAIHILMRSQIRVLKLLMPVVWRSSPEDGDFHSYRGLSENDMFPLSKHVFEGREYFVPRNSELLLSQIYGDWQTPPPVENRQWHHSLVCPTQSATTTTGDVPCGYWTKG